MSNPTSDDFRQLVVRRRDACAKFKDDTASADRREALRFYRGDSDGMAAIYGDSGDGLSSVVSRDTMEAVESMMPALVRPFVAGDEVVSFEPVGPEDEEGAKQSTDYVNYVFTTHNNAFRFVHDSMKDGLLFRLGVAKTVMEEEDEGPPEKYEGLSAIEVQAAEMSDRKIVGDIEQDETTGTFGITLAPKKVKKYRCYVVAPDEFLYEERLASLKQATFLGHSKQTTLSDLVAMGVDKKLAQSLGSGRADNNDEADDRHAQEDETDLKQDDMARQVWVDECYIKTYAGNGSPVLEWRKVLIGGNKNVLLNGPKGEEIDDHPFSTWTPIPVPHRLVGLSIHDQTRDIQINKTALQRELNNAMYLANRPMREVVEGQVNIDDLLNPQVGGVVRVKQSGMVTPMPSGGDAAFSAGMAMIEYQDTVREARTGVTRYNQGMDTNSLNKTATGMNIIANASQQRQELVARQYAEFLKDVFRKLLGLVSRHGDKNEVIRLRGKWVEVDPTDWKTNYDMTTSVGLGTNNKDQLVGQLQALLQIQRDAIQLQGGVQGPLVMIDNVHEVLKRLQEAMGLKGDKYFTDPGEGGEQQPQQPPPDPMAAEMAKMQAEGQIEIEKAKMKAATDLQIAQIKAQSAFEIEQMKAQMQMGMTFAPPEMPAEPQFAPEGMVPPEMAQDASGGAYMDDGSMM